MFMNMCNDVQAEQHSAQFESLNYNTGFFFYFLLFVVCLNFLRRLAPCVTSTGVRRTQSTLLNSTLPRPPVTCCLLNVIQKSFQRR